MPDGAAVRIRSPARGRRINMGRKAFDASGQKFGHLTVLGRSLNVASTHSAQWNCLCDCGKEVSVTGSNLKAGITRSCGCFWSRENFIPASAERAIYGIWHRAKARAKKQGLQFSLDLSDIAIPEFCPILGLRLEQSSTQGSSSSSPSLDRIFPERGYVKGNVRIISQKANRIKNDATAEELGKILDDSHCFEIFAYA